MIFIDFDGEDNSFFLPTYAEDLFQIKGLEISGSSKNIEILMAFAEDEGDFDLSQTPAASQEQIFSALQMAANRAAQFSSTASDKQIRYLSSLIFKAGEEADGIDCGLTNSTATLTKSQACFYIEEYLK